MNQILEQRILYRDQLNCVNIYHQIVCPKFLSGLTCSFRTVNILCNLGVLKNIIVLFKEVYSLVLRIGEKNNLESTLWTLFLPLQHSVIFLVNFSE